jgi:mannose-6-phosphate isomerase-like protein (cupin superfamily)
LESKNRWRYRRCYVKPVKAHYIHLHEGEFVIVPRGIEHKPVAEDNIRVLLFERKTTINIGNIRNVKTAPDRV